MGLTMGFSQCLTQDLTLAQRLVQRQKHVLGLRLALIHSLQGEQYKPRAMCPDCEHILTPVEILNGFNRDPNDFTTKCPSCHQRFPAQLKSSRIGSSVTIAFYCDGQTQSRLAEHKHLAPEEFRKEEPSLYHSAIFHNGCLKTAFARCGIEYSLETITDPREKIVPFLGKLHDTVIASLSGLSRDAVRRLRLKHRIAACKTEDQGEDE